MMTRSLRKPSFANAAVRKGAAQKPTPIRRIVKKVISVFVSGVIALVFYSGYVFAGRMGVLSDVYKADKYVSQKKMDSAVTAYEDTVSAMEKAGIKGELVNKLQIMAKYRIG